MKTAALIVIGDEILSGKVKDDNTHVFTQAMFEKGIRVERVFVIPDEIDVIASFVRECSAKYSYVFTSGGVGPTHDDRTLDAIAHAFDLPLAVNEQALAYFRKAQFEAGRGDVVSDAQLKMLCFPHPSQIYFLKPLWLPLVVVNNVYIFPGVPSLFEKMVKGFIDLFQGGKFFRELIFTDKSESTIAFSLKQVQDEHPDVAIGSYPQMPGKPFNVMISIEGLVCEHVSLVASLLLPLINGRKTEDV